MPSTLTQLISTLQTSLIDDGTRYNTNTCTAAIREALRQFNERAPMFQSELVDAVADQYDYEVTDLDSRAVSLIGVWLRDATGGENHTPVAYTPYMDDDRLFFRLAASRSSGTFLVRYTIHHTISGLDSETDSTMSLRYENILLIGARAEAMQIRAISRVEPINLQSEVTNTYRAQIQELRALFNNALAHLAFLMQPRTQEAATSGWNDSYHNWDV